MEDRGWIWRWCEPTWDTGQGNVSNPCGVPRGQATSPKAPSHRSLPDKVLTDLPLPAAHAGPSIRPHSLTTKTWISCGLDIHPSNKFYNNASSVNSKGRIINDLRGGEN